MSRNMYDWLKTWISWDFINYFLRDKIPRIGLASLGMDIARHWKKYEQKIVHNPLSLPHYSSSLLNVHRNGNLSASYPLQLQIWSKLTNSASCLLYSHPFNLSLQVLSKMCCRHKIDNKLLAEGHVFDSLFTPNFRINNMDKCILWITYINNESGVKKVFREKIVSIH